MYHSFIPQGSIEKSEVQNGCLILYCTNGKARIKLISQATAQIQAVPKNEEFDDFSYSVVSDQEIEITTFFENQQHISLQTDLFKIIIDKSNFEISFTDLKGKVILKDEPGMGLQWHKTGFTHYKHKRKGEKFMGLGEKSGPLDKTGNQYQCWNTDQFGFGSNSDPLYASIPFYLGCYENIPYGIFLDNTSKTHFNFGASNHRYSFFKAESGPLNYYFFYSGDVAGILKEYMHLTGKAPLPAKWSLGFQQCRYSYYPQSEVLQVAATFREKKIPCDVLYLDIHYMDAYKVFTWHPEHFPQPDQMLKKMHDLGFKIVVILDPGIKIDPDYEIYQSGLKNKVFVEYIDGQLMEGDVWPGTCVFPDFTNPATRKWWGSYVLELKNQGIDGFWNDMNEPAIWGNAFPDATRFDYDGKKRLHSETHNVYGMQMSRSTYEGAKEAKPEQRTFHLTRAAYAGTQRYAAIWTGDNVSNEEHLLLSARMTANLGLVGMPFAGADIGGFVGDCSAELYRRWIALGAFLPLFRSHTMINSRSAEPWSFGEETEEVARNYIQLRYKLLPYLYSLFDTYRQTGIPPVRSLFIDYFADENSYRKEYENQFMLGDYLLICPVLPGEELKKIYLPKGKWYDMYNDTPYMGGQTHIIDIHPHRIPVFVKQGAILPICNLEKHFSDTIINEELELHIYNIKEKGIFSLYDDDGTSYEYLQKKYHKRQISIDPDKKIIKFSASEGSYMSPIKKLTFYLHDTDKVYKYRLGDKWLKAENANYHFVKPISNFDPFEHQTDNSQTIFGVKKLTIPFTTQAFFIEFIKD